MSQEKQDFKIDTQCIHTGYHPRDHKHAANCPIYLTSTFEFDTAQACAKAFAGCPEEDQQHIYSRLSNPTNDVIEERVAKLEGAEAGLVFSSGMGAISSVLWTFLNAGSVMVTSNRVYGCTFALFAHQLTRFGIIVEFVDFTDLQQVEQAVNKYETVDIMYTESIQNPTNDVVDLQELAKIAKRKSAMFVVDNTFATPLCCQPLMHGADIVIHSATKYFMNGVSLAGICVGKADDITKVRYIGLKDCTGAVLDAAMAFSMIQSTETLYLRVSRISENALKLAQYLETHPKIDRVIQTGLASHPQASIIQKQMTIKSTGIISVYLKGGFEECCNVMNKLKMVYRAVSLGKTYTLANHPASMTHSAYSPEERLKYGIADNLVRIAVGCENISDIIEDFKQALE